MEEAEVPLEHLHEHVHETAKHSPDAWMSWVALSTAILAVLAAIASLLSGEHANETAVLDAKIAFTGAPSESDQSKRARYEKEQEEIRSEAERKQTAAKSYFHKHEVFARGVTMFQIAIAIAAISALTKKRSFWVVSLVFGSLGCAFLVLAAMTR